MKIKILENEKFKFEESISKKEAVNKYSKTYLVDKWKKEQEEVDENNYILPFIPCF